MEISQQVGEENIYIFGQTSDPVSYTHLDVYKRQETFRQSNIQSFKRMELGLVRDAADSLL